MPSAAEMLSPLAHSASNPASSAMRALRPLWASIRNDRVGANSKRRSISALRGSEARESATASRRTAASPAGVPGLSARRQGGG